MSYHIYTTDGIILKRTAFGEANILLYILTKDLGLIIASARSARLSVSKLAPSLQEYEYASVSCVKGKNGWKVTNAKDIESFFFDYPKYSHKALAGISTILLKMIQGESPHPEIFEIVKTGFEFLKSLGEEKVSSFEILAVLRILYRLGYVVSDNDTEFLLKDTDSWSIEILDKIQERRSYVVGLINKALKESHL